MQLRRDLEHPLEDPHCQWVLNPQSVFPPFEIWRRGVMRTIYIGKCHAIQLSLGTIRRCLMMTKTAKTAAGAESPDTDQKKMEAKECVMRVCVCVCWHSGHDSRVYRSSKRTLFFSICKTSVFTPKRAFFNSNEKSVHLKIWVLFKCVCVCTWHILKDEQLLVVSLTEVVSVMNMIWWWMAGLIVNAVVNRMSFDEICACDCLCLQTIYPSAFKEKNCSGNCQRLAKIW